MEFKDFKVLLASKWPSISNLEGISSEKLSFEKLQQWLIELKWGCQSNQKKISADCFLTCCQWRSTEMGSGCGTVGIVAAATSRGQAVIHW